MKELYEKVKKMSELQKRYFKERNSQILLECKKAEKDVDQLMELIDNKFSAAGNNPKLF